MQVLQLCEMQEIGIVRFHLMNKVFTLNCTKWYHHGERHVLTQEEDAIETNQRGVERLHDALHDIMDHEDFDEFADSTPSEVCTE